MASYPQRQQPQRRVSPVQTPAHASAEDAQQLRQTDDLAHSTASVDSQTLYLNDPKPAGEATNPTQSHPEPTPEESPRQCWICMQDETEDTPESSAWRSPCPCTLTAHETCLLEWADDMQRQKSDITVGDPPSGDLVCPMCQASIVLARPHARLTKIVNTLDSLASRAVVPALGLGLLGSTFIVASHHGAHTIRMIFGPDDAEAILAPRQTGSWLMDTFRSHLPLLDLPGASTSVVHRSARLRLGLPLIPVALITSRTPWAESILPFFPIVLFAANTDAGDTSIMQYHWPPSAALTIATLPYLRVFYGEFMDRVWGAREQAWMKEIQPPRRHDTDEGDNADAARAEVAAGNDDVVQVDIELAVDVELPGAGGDHGVEQAQQDQGERQAAVAAAEALLNHEQRREQALRERIDAAQRQVDAAERHIDELADGLRGRQGRAADGRITADTVVDFASMCKTIIGALLFPSISAAVGEALRLCLPKAWVVPRIVGTGWSKKEVPTGLLQTRWGRSIVGGCLAVVLKDAIRIYCRWRLAQSYRTRRILDYDKNTRRIVR